MLGLFSGNKPDHPLADDTARVAELAELAGTEPLTGLQRITEWLRSVAGAGNLSLAQRETILRQLDDAAQRHARILGREYLTMAHLAPDEENRLWRANRDFWAQLGVAYYGCVTEAGAGGEDDAVRRVEQARLAVRLLRAYAARLKWDQFRYWPASEAVWQSMGRVYLFAFANKFDRREVSAYHGEGQGSSVEQEYLKALVFHISATDGLLPFEIEIAERIVAFFLPRFSISEAPAEGFGYCIDPEQRKGPARYVAGTDITPGMRFFSTVDALEPLNALREALEQGSVPAHLELTRYRSPRIILPVVRHLAGYWAAEPPKREHDRHRVRSDMAVLNGLKAIHACLASDAREQPGVAVWSVENVSQGGLRAGLALSDQQSLYIGTLLGMRPSGGDNWLVGVVRRFSRESGERAVAGVQTLSKHPIAAELEIGGVRHVALLLDAPDEGEVTRVILPGMAFEPQAPAEGMLLAAPLRLVPVELLERGLEFDLASYRVVGQD